MNAENAEALKLMRDSLARCPHLDVSDEGPDWLILTAQGMDPGLVSATFRVTGGLLEVGNIRNYSTTAGYGEHMLLALIAELGRDVQIAETKDSGIVFWRKMMQRHGVVLLGRSRLPYALKPDPSGDFVNMTVLSRTGKAFNHRCIPAAQG